MSNAPIPIFRQAPAEELDAHRAAGWAIAVGSAAILWVFIITGARALMHSLF